MAENTHPNYAKRRAWTLFGVWAFFALHIIHWKLNRTTLAPLELNEVLYTVHQGIVTAGFILMALVMIATLVFGRFFCSWGCHILALQDSCAWILRKLHIRSHPLRSRTLIWVPMGALLYLFVWPQILMAFHGIDTQALHVVENTNGQWSSFVTDDFWRNLPPVSVALSTFFIVGFLMIYLLGSRSFCAYGCPYGAVFKLADQVAPGRIKLSGAADCVQCGTCTVNCTSDILVHKEIKEFGMVTNSNCLKDLDCVAGCPENALGFGWAVPPLFRKKFKLPDYGNRYSFTLVEDLLMAVVFVFSIFIFRGLYGIIPFLMSVGISVSTAYAALLAYRMFRRSSAKVNGLMLKISGKIRKPGYVFLVFSLLLFVFTVHSAFVQYHSYVGNYWYGKLGSDNGNLSPEGENAVWAANALTHLEMAQHIGMVTPVHVRTQLASIYLLQGSDKKAAEQLNAIIMDEPDNLKAQYRLAVLDIGSGNVRSSVRRFKLIVRSKDTDPESRFMKSAAYVELAKLAQSEGNMPQVLKNLNGAITENSENSEAWLGMGMYNYRLGNRNKAIEDLEHSLKLQPESATAHNNLAALYARSGRAEKAMSHYAELVRLQRDNYLAYYNLGMMQMTLGKTDDARSSLMKALSIQPDYDRAKEGLMKLNQAAAQ